MKMRRLFWALCVSALAFPFHSPAQEVAPANKEWVVVDTKLAASLPKTIEAAADAAYKITIKRENKDAQLQKLIERAESLYPLPEKVKAATRRASPVRTKDEPLWWCDNFDGVRIPYALTAGAVDYYKTLVEEFKQNNFQHVGVRMTAASLDYQATAEWKDEWTAPPHISRAKPTFKNVFVVNLTLRWNQYCGNLCAMGFGKQRAVIFDKSGNAIAILGDEASPVAVS